MSFPHVWQDYLAFHNKAIGTQTIHGVLHGRPIKSSSLRDTDILWQGLCGSVLVSKKAEHEPVCMVEFQILFSKINADKAFTSHFIFDVHFSSFLLMPFGISCI
ncbi:MAG: hypothetical protein CMN21_11690 [Rubinisphaera sp.]|nr:hypothetical protein [Rubinisphaera sp.]